VGFLPGRFAFPGWEGKARGSKELRMSVQSPLEGTTDYRLSDRTRMVLALAELRKEWQQATKGGSLLKVETPVGLLLSDIADRLGLTSQERYVFLGGKLINEVDGHLEERVTRKPLL
jgi:hypothetical protein